MLQKEIFSPKRFIALKINQTLKHMLIFRRACFYLIRFPEISGEHCDTFENSELLSCKQRQ